MKSEYGSDKYAVTWTCPGCGYKVTTYSRTVVRKRCTRCMKKWMEWKDVSKGNKD